MVTLVVPGLLLFTGPGEFLWPPLHPVLVGVGLILGGLGLVLVVSTNLLFAKIGQGTLAPWDPTQRLVVRGVYRHVRNPMISGVAFILLGELLASGSLRLLIWFLLFALANLIYIPLVEEPGLEHRFGQAYRVYKQHVPRWLPRLRPWEGMS
jgi:protein-S-isoprenylcysteine O-methyltransferase Ste14